MTAAAQAPGDLAEAYNRPPYHTPPPPRRTPRQLVLDVLLPWRLARLVYGPYRFVRLSASGVVATVDTGLLDPYVRPIVETGAGEVLDPTLERLLAPRLLFGFGVVLVIVRLATGTLTANELFASIIGEDSVVMLLTGPIALLLGCLPLVALARPGTRRQVARLVARPLLVGAATVAVFATMAVTSNEDWYPTGLAAAALGGLVGLWAGLFLCCTLYLVHRNSFGVRAHPLVRPMVAAPLVWLTLLGHIWLVDTKGTSTHGPALVGLLAGPVGVTATAVVEIVLLRRRHRVGFRGPLAPAPRPVAGR